MKLETFIIISLVAICGTAEALQFYEQVELEGNGTLYARTTTDAAQDRVNGSGRQDYVRSLNLETNQTILKSEYNLESNLTERTNQYYVQMNSLDGVEHYISVCSSSDINSASSINRSDYNVRTDYEVEAKMATLSEGITDWDDYNDGKTGSKIAETEMSGNFVLESKLSDDGGRKKIDFGWDPNKMLEDLDSIARAAETKPPKEDVYDNIPDASEASTSGGVFWGSEQETNESDVVTSFEGLPLGIYSKIYRSGSSWKKVYEVYETGNDINDSRSMIFLGGDDKPLYSIGI